MVQWQSNKKSYCLLNGVIFNDLGWPLTQISRAAITRHSIAVISLIAFFTLVLQPTLRGPVHWRDVTFGYLIYWLVLLVCWQRQTDRSVENDSSFRGNSNYLSPVTAVEVLSLATRVCNHLCNFVCNHATLGLRRNDCSWRYETFRMGVQ